MAKDDLTIRQTVRFPQEVHAAIEAVRGEPGKPKASFNDTLLYLVREGLKATGHAMQETEPGQWVPVLLAA